MTVTPAPASLVFTGDVPNLEPEFEPLGWLLGMTRDFEQALAQDREDAVMLRRAELPVDGRPDRGRRRRRQVTAPSPSGAAGCGCSALHRGIFHQPAVRDADHRCNQVGHRVAAGLRLPEGQLRTKIADVATDLGAPLHFGPHGAVLRGLGLVLGAANMLGGCLGARTSTARGSRFIQVVSSSS